MSISGNWSRRQAGVFGRLGEMERRKFMKLSGMSAAALIFGAGPFTGKVIARPTFRDNPFSLGVASGDPSPEGVVLWTRLAPDPLAEDGRGGMPEAKVPVRWEIAEDKGFSRVVQTGSVPARPELGHSVHVEVTNLKPASEYFYRFKAGDEASPTGRTKTTPGFEVLPGRLTFAMASCQMYEHGHYTAYGHMAGEDLDLVLHLGDYIYEYGVAEYPAKSGVVRPHVPESEVLSLPDYRRRHAQYRTDENLQAAHAAFPWVVTWDDHEVENNYADEISENNDPVEVFLQRRAAAYQAYYEHMPLRRSSVPRGPDMQLYRRLSYGALAEFNVLDTRQYRDDQASGDGIHPPTRETRDQGRTLTGEAQERWLLKGLNRSPARWNVLAQQVFFAELDLRSGPGELFNMDAWDGYEGQRNRLVDFLASRKVRNPIVLTGDVHTSWANDIKANFDDASSETVGTEFVATSITSDGNGSGALTYESPISAANPHIKFFNDQRGYLRCELTPGEWRADYRIVPYVNLPGAPVSTAASFVVENGKPGARKVSGALPTDRLPADIERGRIRAQEEAG